MICITKDNDRYVYTILNDEARQWKVIFTYVIMTTTYLTINYTNNKHTSKYKDIYI